MKVWIGAFVLMVALASCQENDTVSEFTGNEATYVLQQASEFEVSGIATLKEKKDGSTIILIELIGTDGIIKLPAHLTLRRYYDTRC